MKCIAAVVLLALVGVALAKPLETESIEPAKTESLAVEAENAARNKRGLLLGAAYTAPVAYSAYTAPVAYTAAAAYSYPYAAYSSYPYYAGAYSSPYYVL
ncbi:PREDICTED: uncharacterized protein LOC107192390 [Dufourea novaeangliae]|uniref:uncharacterized protein LOC107192390 n=1 Tax=Dufourea novaeangliae TaxID=178035 RepID=UPI0007670A3F|nr:PREDICTED: uncharacterized protein LOC107192390 [Dufourea novaeangliae]